MLALLAAPSPALAQTGASPSDPQPVPQQNPVRVHHPSQDERFVNGAMAGGLFEIRSSKLALEKAQRGDVKQVAQMLIKDHTRSERELEQIVGKQMPDLRLPASLPMKEKSQVQELRNTSSSDFDAAFITMQMKAHQAAIDIFSEAAKNASQPELKAFARKTLRVLETHLQRIQKLA
ncbi:DUF4142 domain-containing protein [Radicibacter daui]|uniref:DUF4142 domain-containing protein n=1 Tax=Radicibacter daui TaxID=3064829 RepID=UPI004046A1E5